MILQTRDHLALEYLIRHTGTVNGKHPSSVNVETQQQVPIKDANIKLTLAALYESEGTRTGHEYDVRP